MSLQRDLSKRDLSIAAAVIAVVLTALSSGFFMKQKADEDKEVARMNLQMKRELGLRVSSDNAGIVEVEEQQVDPHFMP